MQIPGKEEDFKGVIDSKYGNIYIMMRGVKFERTEIPEYKEKAIEYRDKLLGYLEKNDEFMMKYLRVKRFL